MNWIKLTIEVKLEDSFNYNEDERLWLENEILVGDGSLILHSNEIGDSLGVIKSVKNIQFLSKEQ